LFLAVTTVLWVLFYDNISVAAESVLFMLAIVAGGLLFSRTRRMAAGFVLAFVVLTPFNPAFTEIWWRHITDEVIGATRPLTRWIDRRQQFRAWVDSRKGHPVEVNDALVLVRNLYTGCIPSYTAAAQAGEDAIPADVAAIFRKTDCDRFEPTLFESNASFPDRYFRSDTGWRWDYSRQGNSSERYRLVLRPDPLLELQGPIVEVTGDGWYRVRPSEGAPLTMIRTPVPMMTRLRECIPLAAAAVEPRYYPVLWQFLSNPSYLRGVCRDLIVDEEQDSAEGDRVILVRRAGAEPDPLGPTLLHYRVLSPGRFEIRAWSYGRRYLLDAEGVLHAASAPGPGRLEDGPPVPCEIEPRRACM
jgi:hypothetical protein